MSDESLKRLVQVSKIEIVPTNHSTERDGRPKQKRFSHAACTLNGLQRATKRRYNSQQNQSSTKPEDTTLTAVSLQYNETSIAAVCRWTVKSVDSTGATQSPKPPHVTASNTKRKRPLNKNHQTVEAQNRLCLVCNLYGHYELECPTMAKETAVTMSTALRSLEQENNSGTYNVAVETCKGYNIEQRATDVDFSNLATQPTEIDDPVPYALERDDNDTQRKTMQVDNFLIKSSETIETLTLPVGSNRTDSGVSGKNCSHPSTFIVCGSLVSWLLKKEENEIGTLCAGVAVKFEIDSVKVRVMQTIQADGEVFDTGVQQACVCPPADSFVWIPRRDVFAVVEANSRYRRVSPYSSVSTYKSRSMSYAKRYKKSGRVDENDLSMKPKSVLRKNNDGTYSRPAGRCPAGLEWDEKRGVWMPKLKGTTADGDVASAKELADTASTPEITTKEGRATRATDEEESA